MKHSKPILWITALCILCSCSCSPEELSRYAFRGMETLMGKGFLPSDEIRQLGGFAGVSVNLSSSKEGDTSSSTIFLRLENGDPVLLGNQPEVLARKCAEIYLRDFEKSTDYQQITVQFVQADPANRDNFAMQEYTFNTQDF